MPSAFVAVVFDSGHFGVAIFFALSGFVIAHSLSDTLTNVSSFGRFILRRSVRLDPPYWASMVLVVGLATVSARVVGKPFEFPTPGQILAHLVYLQEILRYPEISSVYWTLTYEVQFYVFMAGTLLLISNGYIRLWSLTALALFSAYGLFAANGLFLSMWCCFFVGALACWARSDRGSLAAFLIVFTGMVWFGVHAGNIFIAISAAAAMTIYAITRDQKIDAVFNSRPTQFMGAISYSLYLTHNPITGASFFVTSKFLGGGPLAEAIGLITALLSCVAVAALLWLFIEKPSQRLSHRLSVKGLSPIGRPDRVIVTSRRR